MANLLRTALNIRHKAEEAASGLPALMVQAQKAVASILHGDHAQRKSGAGEKFWQFREYSPSDRPQDIDWRQSAKTQRVFIRQRERQTTQTSVLWCARHAGMDFSSPEAAMSKAQAAKIITLAFGLLSTQAGDQVRLFGTKKTGRSEAMLEDLGFRLCERAQSALPLPDLALDTLPAHATFMQVGDFLSPIEEIEHTFKALAARADSGVVVQVLDPAELELSYDGRIIFEAPDNHDMREIVNHVGSIRGAYKQRIDNHIAALHDLCRHCGWTHIVHRTDRPISETMTEIWQHMSRSTNGGG